MKALIARFRAWWRAGLQSGQDLSPEELQVIRDVERMWEGRL